MKATNTFLILFVLGLFVCNGQENISSKEDKLPQVINRDNSDAVKKFREMDLDSFYDDLLNPNNVSDTERKEVVKSWGDFHKKIIAYLKEANFDWNSDEASIRINNRIYFEKDGSVNYYVFKIANSTISEQTKQEFHRILENFVSENKINFTKEKVFAQCGMVEYQNN